MVALKSYARGELSFGGHSCGKQLVSVFSGGTDHGAVCSIYGLCTPMKCLGLCHACFEDSDILIHLFYLPEKQASYLQWHGGKNGTC